MIEIEVLRKVQKSLSRYLFAKGYLSWDGIRKACKNIILSLPDEDQKTYDEKAYPEFEIFIPLLKNGSAEVCRSKNRSTLLFCMNPEVNLTVSSGKEFFREQEYYSIYKQKSETENKFRKDIQFKQIFDPLLFLKSYPSLQQQIIIFAEQTIQLSSLRYEQNLMNYQYEKKDTSSNCIGIYKLDNNAWTSPYLLDKNKKIRKIPYYAEDPDSMNLARLYVRTNNSVFIKPVFEYVRNTQELICNRYSELPILLARALLLFEPKQLTSKEFCTNHPLVPFKKIPEDAVKELKRIFSEKYILVR